MRIFCLQIHRREWIFYAEPQKAMALVEADPPATDFKGRFWQRLQKTYSESLIYIQTSPRPFWVWVRKMLAWLEKLIHPSETLMRALVGTEQIEFIYPANVSYRFVERKWRRFLRYCARRHKRGVILNLILLPFTAAATILPGPNVFVAWNGFRLYSHIMASRGAERGLQKQISLKFSPTSELRTCETPQGRLSQQTAERLEEELQIKGLVEYLRRLKCLSA